jgi:hypothetical protein
MAEQLLETGEISTGNIYLAAQAPQSYECRSQPSAIATAPAAPAERTGSDVLI